MNKTLLACYLLLFGLFILSPAGYAAEDKLGKYAWLEGRWENENKEAFDIVIIEKDRYKYVSWMWNDSPSDINSAEWIPIDIAMRDIALWEGTFLTLSEDLSVVVTEENHTIEIITGEFSSDRLVKVGGTFSKGGNSQRASIKSSDKRWERAFSFGKCAVFCTGYSHVGDEIFIALFPFIYSEDGYEGKMYQFSASSDYQRLYLMNSGDYEVHGNYVRFSHISGESSSRGQRRNDRMYTLSEENGIIRLDGRVIGQPDNKMTMTLSSDSRVISLAEEILQRPNHNQHDL